MGIIRNGLERALNFGRAAVVSLPLLLGTYGCEPDEPIVFPPTKDTTPPKIIISSPLESKVYNTDTILYSGTIIENYLKDAWYSIDNENTKTYLA